MSFLSRSLGWFGCVLAFAACSAGSDASSGQGGAGASASNGDTTSGFETQSSGTTMQGPQVGEVTGRVLAPEGTIPISGALVYIADAPPPAIPDGVYCDKCVELDETTDYAFSKADGSFTLALHGVGSKYLVVQKGAFRRYRPIELAKGAQAVDASMTTLPARRDKANGDDIPKMAIRVGQWDAIEDSLGKLGVDIGDVDLFEFGGLDPDNLFDDYATLSKYHIVFVPCSGSSGTDCNDFTTSSATVKQNLQNFVAAGGKLYVTDYSYDFVRQPWPEYLDWQDQTSQLGSACLTGEYDAPAVVEDPGLSEWLAAQGITSFEVEANWTRIVGVNTVATTDVNDMPVMVTPKVWVKAGDSPSTVSFERSCGRVLFSTYHTEGTGGSELLAQERALLYVLLEVAVCTTAVIPE